MSKGKYHRKGKSKQGPGSSKGGGAPWLFGLHAVSAALQNPEREVRRLMLTQNAEENLKQAGIDLPQNRELAGVSDLDALLPAGSVHQGVAALVDPLPALALEDVPEIRSPDEPALVVVLDQVTDPQNVGAILRSAAAFGAAALITQDRHSPSETSSLAKAASGGLETVPWVRVVNLARTLDHLAELGFWKIGLDGSANTDLADLDMGNRIVLVLGSEGKGLRSGTQAHCDALARLPITSRVESLNVSNAAAVALYELSRGR
jgi:23S rRNA (guanosine2251-2'-O)-methyltransferase